jgi:transcriptional regulator NrdR
LKTVKPFDGEGFATAVSEDLRHTSESRACYKSLSEAETMKISAEPKIERGLAAACWKRKVSVEQIQTLAAEIEAHILDTYEKEVTSEEIGNLCMEFLRELDQVAFVRFASVYRRFSDIQDFVEELRPILKGAPRRAD